VRYLLISFVVRSWDTVWGALLSCLATKVSMVLIKQVVRLVRTSGSKRLNAVLQWAAGGALASLLLYLLVVNEFRYVHGRRSQWNRVLWNWLVNWLFALLAMETMVCYLKYQLKLSLMAMVKAACCREGTVVVAALTIPPILAYLFEAQDELVPIPSISAASMPTGQS